MKLNTMIKNLESIKGKTIDQSAINSLCRFLNSLRYNSESRVDRSYSELIIDIINSENKKLTKEQNEFGRNWLLNRYVNKKGQPRKQLQHDFNYIDISVTPNEAFEIITDLKDFRLVGFTGEYNAYCRMYTNIKPVYKAIGKNGHSFNYCFGHWGALICSPEIINTLF